MICGNFLHLLTASCRELVYTTKSKYCGIAMRLANFSASAPYRSKSFGNVWMKCSVIFCLSSWTCFTSLDVWVCATKRGQLIELKSGNETTDRLAFHIPFCGLFHAQPVVHPLNIAVLRWPLFRSALIPACCPVALRWVRALRSINLSCIPNLLPWGCCRWKNRPSMHRAHVAPIQWKIVPNHESTVYLEDAFCHVWFSPHQLHLHRDGKGEHSEIRQPLVQRRDAMSKPIRRRFHNLCRLKCPDGF